MKNHETKEQKQILELSQAEMKKVQGGGRAVIFITPEGSGFCSERTRTCEEF